MTAWNIGKSRLDLEELKRQWLLDPCWDIYETEGFEEYRAELEAFQQSVEKASEIAAQERVKKFMKTYDIPPSQEALGEYLMRLEDRIKKLEQTK